MPAFAPFAALRYGPSVDLDRVIAPPYDVIGPEERRRLAQRDPANAVHLELPKPDPGAGRDRYQEAARLLADWRASGVLVADAGPALYPYRMTGPDGRSTTGLLGALGLGAEGRPDDVLPHEETLPKPRSDRLDLLRATRTNLSPIWGLSLAPGLTEALEVDRPPVAEATDDDGVRHQLWVSADPAATAALAELVGSAPVVVADGHHRYETALAYRDERRAAGARPGGPEDAVLALVVELRDDQVQVGAIHRTVAGLPADVDLGRCLGRYFDLEAVGPPDPELAAARATEGRLVLFTPEGTWTLDPRPGTAEAAGSDLDSAMVALALAEAGPAEVEHRHSWSEATDPVVGGAAQAALLLRPVRADQIAAWAADRRRMPPKTTYFRPKPRTGMVFRTLG